MRKTLYALLLLPTLALAETPKTPPPAAAGPGPGNDPARALKRMQLARTLGLATVLDLDTEQALKLGQTMSRFDDRRRTLREQAREARDTLHAAAVPGGKASAAEVDGAIAKLLDLRAQSQALDKEMLQAVTQNLSPQQKARAVMFLGSFRHRMDRRMMMEHGRGGPGGPGGPGMMRGAGRMGRGQGPGMMDPGERDHTAMRDDDDDAAYAEDL
jgi:hypothetical protein